MKKGFTLAEIMIVLSVIAILTAILLPAARNAMPNEKVMKFKKAHNTLYTAIRELVTSDKYFSNGDLGTRIDGEGLQNVDGERTYVCECLADVLNTKAISCNDTDGTGTNSNILLNGLIVSSDYVPTNPTDETINTAKRRFDSSCKTAQNQVPQEIVLSNGTIFYFSKAGAFGTQKIYNSDGTSFNKRYFSPPNQFPANFSDETGVDVVYKPYCVDIDGFNAGEDPFGYGIRADGKILNGARADEWLSKSIQEK